MFPADRPAYQKDSHTKVFEIMHSIGTTVALFDSVVKVFARGVGFSMLPSIQDPFLKTSYVLGDPA